MAKAIRTIGSVVGIAMVAIGVATGNYALAAIGAKVTAIAPIPTPPENVIGLQRGSSP